MKTAAAFILILSGSLADAQSVTVTGSVVVMHEGRMGAGKPDSSNAIVSLRPAGGAPARPAGAPRPKFEIKQQHKRFDPRVLAVPVGSAVDFPNLDPFFHNVFSMFDGKRFDLGLYEAGKVPRVTFDRVGICYIFCNIHPEMSAVIVVVDSPYYAISNRTGEFSIADVPVGRYQLSVWHERGKLEAGSEFPREVTIGLESKSLRPIKLVDSGQLVAPHQNKYGHDYDAPPAGAIYK